METNKVIFEFDPGVWTIVMCQLWISEYSIEILKDTHANICTLRTLIDIMHSQAPYLNPQINYINPNINLTVTKFILWKRGQAKLSLLYHCVFKPKA